MSWQVPMEWQYDPPEGFVVGDGPYASALAFVLGTVPVRLDQLKAGPAPSKSGRFSRILEDLKWVLLVVPEAMPASEALQCHQYVWKWVEKLSSEGDQSEISFFFILPPGASETYDESLATGLILPVIDAATTGHAVWRRSAPLNELLDLLTGTPPQDAAPLRGRRAADSRHIALTRLRNAARESDPTSGRDAAKAVLAAFRGQEYHLDLFCRPPWHQNGNLLREWLNTTVTSGVSPEEWTEKRTTIADWLALDPMETR